MTMDSIDEIIDLLTLKKLDEQTFEGESQFTPWGRVFGGQVLGQSLHAAYQTVPKDRFAHSMHGYFILAGDIKEPIRYEVDNIRDGRSFTTRRVVAFQHGKAIFNMSASFQKVQEGIDHQITEPNVLPPDVLLPDYKQMENLKDSYPELYARLTAIYSNALEFRPVENHYKNIKQKSQPYRHIWVRATESIPDDLALNHQLMAYVSDYNLLTTAILPHLDKVNRAKLFLASIDHAIWFHRDFNLKEWLLYATDSPSASNARGFSRGSIFDKEGRLVVSVAQEGLIREMK